MNHDQLRQSAEATLSNAYSSSEYILASAVLELIDVAERLIAEVTERQERFETENAALRAALEEIVEYSDPLSVAQLIATRALALGDAS